MKITISKILNRTDLAQSGSHGGLVVTKHARTMLRDFFGMLGIDREFRDENGTEDVLIHYAEYTANGTTPNDRITPIGKYATRHNLMPGDRLVFQKVIDGGTGRYSIRYERKPESAFFVGKSNERSEVLNPETFVAIMAVKTASGEVVQTGETSYEMDVRYQGSLGRMEIEQDDTLVSLCVNGEHIEKNNKYYELDTSVVPFELKKTDTWKLELSMDSDVVEMDEKADEELLRTVSSDVVRTVPVEYEPRPEPKQLPRLIGEREGAGRDRNRADNALARAGFLCEYNNEHELFLRKTQPVNYTEPHHLIPLQFDELFANSLDVEANIVSLCSNCHNLIHYGADAERVIRKLWQDRQEAIKAAGIGVMRNDVELDIDILLSFYG